MRAPRLVKLLLWICILADVLIIAGLVTKVWRTGMGGLSAWLRHVHFVPIYAANGRATFLLQPDYRFTIFYVGWIVGVFTATALLLRAYRKHASSHRNRPRP
jgi:hypothetical protein